MQSAGRFVSIVALLLALATPAGAQTTGAISGFGGLSLDATDLSSADLGGSMAFAPTPHLQVFGEAGRMGNVLPPISNALFSWGGVGLSASALYGEGGLRIVARPHTGVSPYAEASAGMARLTVGTTGLGSAGDAVAALATSFIDRTGPTAGAGGGVLFRAGPFQVDLGYRYKQIFAPEPLRTVLGLGQPLRSNQVRLGAGIRF